MPRVNVYARARARITAPVRHKDARSRGAVRTTWSREAGQLHAGSCQQVFHALAVSAAHEGKLPREREHEEGVAAEACAREAARLNTRQGAICLKVILRGKCEDFFFFF